MRPKFYDNPEYRQKQAEFTHKYWKKGVFISLIKPLETRKCKNPNCQIEFQVKPYEKKIYCSSRCSATVNNLKRPRKSYFCLECNKKLSRSGRKYCSIKCQSLYSYRKYIETWKNGLVSGNRGIATKILSKHIKRYLLEKYAFCCSICGWNQPHPTTKVIPLEVDHIDGNADNNSEENLRLLCPNCHSLTPNFRNLNKGKGRAWRTSK